MTLMYLGVSGGAPWPLENFLDHYFNRKKGYVSAKSAFLDDPNLELALPQNASDAYPGSPAALRRQPAPRSAYFEVLNSSSLVV